jgi:hypothetical protein
MGIWSNKGATISLLSKPADTLKVWLRGASYACIRTRTHAKYHIHTYDSHTHIIYIYIYIYIYVCIHIYIHTYIHTHTNTHTYSYFVVYVLPNSFLCTDKRIRDSILDLK